MLRFVLAAAALVPCAYSQNPGSVVNQPSFNWIEQIDNSGLDSFAGLGVDAAGNTYIAGSTSAINFPVQSAAQKTIASSGLYRITGTGSAYSSLPLPSATFVAIDPQNPNTIYVVSNQKLLRSANGGSSFTTLAVPAKQVWTVAINPSNDQIIYAGTFDQGLFKSTDGGATWSPSNGSLVAVEPGEFEFQSIWIDPNHPNVLLAYALGSLYRSADAGSTWQLILSDAFITTLNFDQSVPGLIYIVDNQGNVSVSTDEGQTFAALKTPVPFGTVIPDPSKAGRLIGLAMQAIYVSADSGVSWTLAQNLPSPVNFDVYAADWAHGLLCFVSSRVLEVPADLSSVTAVGPPSVAQIFSIAAANGIVYSANAGSRDVYVTKLDSSGNIVYSTYFGGSGDDGATAIAVDLAGDVYVTGITNSADFPVTKGAYAGAGPSFVFKLNPDGSVAYSTYGPAGSTGIAALSLDATGAVYVGGVDLGGLATTPGAYQTTCQYCGITSNGFFGVITESGYAFKLDPTGSTLVYSTYIGGEYELAPTIISSIAAAPDGSLYLAGFGGLFHLNAAGSAVLGSASASPQTFTPQTLGLAPDGTIYVGGTANQFTTTPGAFQTAYNVIPSLGNGYSNLPAAFIARWDAQLANVLDATYFGPGKSINAIAFDAAGNVYLGGGTSQQGLPTRTPLQLGFAPSTGFLSELSGDLSTLIFSGYFGDTDNFSVGGIGVLRGGSGGVAIGGLAAPQNGSNSGPFNPWVNSVEVVPTPSIRIDSIVNAASLLDGPISPGEIIVVQGAGFGSSPDLTINGASVPVLTSTATSITLQVPQGLAIGAAEIAVAGIPFIEATSNRVLVQVNPASPAIFSQNGSGVGQGYVLNKDGTLNTPSNPAAPGDPISVFANGVGPVSVNQGYAVSQYPVDVYVDGLFANGIEAFLNPVPQYPGIGVYEIQVYIPNPPDLVSANPNLQNFTYPPLVPLTMKVNGVASQNGITISISQ